MQIIIDDSALQQKLQVAADKLADTTQLMQRLSMTLLNVTEENFNAEGRPKWAALNPAYDARRKGGQMLQLSGQLAASITPFYGADHAGVGSNKVYAAIQQFGGQTKAHTIRPKNKKALAFGGGVFKKVEHPGSKIPARPYLPMDKQGNLQREAFEDVAETIDLYLKSIF
ncbi:phage virion morphogenesis protein [Acinetobacter haemolyticus]|uniref:phage virion morphogenesis protein n=1 Tax=Acinetobacter haemolyticus TaxID=29430 RepID=UPI000F74BA7B|nr:phage virion morphogenesis protein [Acinetobacter haemolyticus]RSN77904.1 phage virion morphogenesis protein [Acinetobacter haemolyticus]